jgi:ectoine hydroxylase-related dioxygenase (phytanoyl-CoA dioxygenase family)
MTPEITIAEMLKHQITHLDTHGYVVIEDTVDPAHVAILRDKMTEDLRALQARPNAPYNWNSGNVQQEPPPFPPYLFKDVLLNERVIAFTKAVLGPGVTNAFYSGNTAVKSTERQPVHADIGHIWTNIYAPPYAVVVNLLLVDTSAENGATEIWPGSHKDTSTSLHADIKVSQEKLDAWKAAGNGPVQLSVKAGTIVVRDIRLWHAGMPNHTDTPRPMIAMIHWAGWYAWKGSVNFPKGTEDFFKHPDLTTNANFVDGPIDYIGSPQAHEYEK